MARMTDEAVTTDYRLHVLMRDGTRTESMLDAENLHEAAVFGANRACDQCRASEREILSITIFPIYEKESG